VAHAISTHKVENEYDYFTAVDDFPPEDKIDAGAAMIGTVEFNSSTLYRYATIAVHDLQEQIGEGAAQAVRLFAEGFVKSMPTGKQNTFAHGTIPGAILVTMRDDQPVNLVGAFEKAIPASEEGYLNKSGQALAEQFNTVCRDWLEFPVCTLADGQSLSGLEGATFLPLKELLPALEQAVADQLSK
jgi:CRISPR system Cascade subunit CasC